ncbi:insulinase family protein [Kitasatospora sp. NPDC086791]|uniref:M16 family metallopeptidase n=1 Tax=Kitasatospora sp. NPDC086791 TaxID=3155178 RepID=UPI0034217E70
MTVETLPPLPAPGPPPPIAEPDLVDVELPTGLRLVAVRRPTVPLVQLRLGVPFGGATPAHTAAAELLAATLTAGTAARDRAALDGRLADSGGTLRTVVGPETLRVSGQALAAALPGLLAVLADCLAGAAYPAAVVEAERARLLDRVRITEAMPARAARTALLRHCFGDHPATRETPAAAEVAAVRADDLAALHRSHLVPRGSVLVLVGDLDPAATAELAARLFDGWRAPGPVSRPEPLPPVKGDGEPVVVHRPGLRQCEARFATDGLPPDHPGRAALHLAEQVFGGSFSARLTQHLRERRGWIYSGHSAVEPRLSSTLVTLQFASGPQHARAAVEETLDELGRLSGDRPPTAEEIADARGHAAGLAAITASTQAGLADALHTAVLAGLGPHWPAHHADRLRTVPDDEVRAAAARLRPESFAVVLLAPEPA